MIALSLHHWHSERNINDSFLPASPPPQLIPDHPGVCPLCPAHPVSSPIAECLFVPTALLIQDYCDYVTSSSSLFILLCCQSCLWAVWFFCVHVCVCESVQTGAQTKEDGCLYIRQDLADTTFTNEMQSSEERMRGIKHLTH